MKPPEHRMNSGFGSTLIALIMAGLIACQQQPVPLPDSSIELQRRKSDIELSLRQRALDEMQESKQKEAARAELQRRKSDIEYELSLRQQALDEMQAPGDPLPNGARIVGVSPEGVKLRADLKNRILELKVHLHVETWLV